MQDSGLTDILESALASARSRERWGFFWFLLLRPLCVYFFLLWRHENWGKHVLFMNSMWATCGRLAIHQEPWQVQLNEIVLYFQLVLVVFYFVPLMFFLPPFDLFLFHSWSQTWIGEWGISFIVLDVLRVWLFQFKSIHVFKLCQAKYAREKVSDPRPNILAAAESSEAKCVGRWLLDSMCSAAMRRKRRSWYLWFCCVSFCIVFYTSDVIRCC